MSTFCTYTVHTDNKYFNDDDVHSKQNLYLIDRIHHKLLPWLFQSAVNEFMKTHRDGAKSAGQIPDGPSMDEYKLMLKDTLVSAG